MIFFICGLLRQSKKDSGFLHCVIAPVYSVAICSADVLISLGKIVEFAF